MTVSSDTILALLPPAIAISWVIADATTGMVAADRTIQVVLPAVQIVRTEETAVDTRQKRAPVIVCSYYNAVAQTQRHGLPKANLLRLCNAGLNFTSSLPKT